MLIAVFALLGFLSVYFDWRHWRRLCLSGSSLGKWLFGGWAVMTDSLLPLIVVLGGLMPDNTILLTKVIMWLCWAWMVTVIPRAVFYVFNHFNHRVAGAVAALGVIGLFVWGLFVGRDRLQITQETFLSERLPAAFDSFRIVQISDIHLGTMVHVGEELQRIVDCVNALNPDLVIFTGDLIHIRHTELTPREQRILSGLKASCGVFSVTGNHDVGVYVRDTLALPLADNESRLVDKQEAMGWHVLRDSSVVIGRGGEYISLSGIAFDTDLREKRHDSHLPAPDFGRIYRGVSDTLFNITAVHLPQYWDDIRRTSYGDLTLSGHVHAMQIKINILGRSFSPARLLYKRWSGRYEEQGKMLYINDGTGCVVYPMRLGAWPEITLITLKSCE